MFGLSLPKLLVLALIVAAVWYGYKWVGRLDQERKAKLREEGSGDRVGRDSQDLVQCALCGTYGPMGLDRCPEGRDDCPMVGD
jgi:uncharacterized protein